MMKEMESVSPEELARQLQRGEALRLIDVREADEWALNRLPGAEHIPLAEVPVKLAASVRPDERVVVYCHHGVRSAHAQAWMLNQGFRNVVNLEGGIDAWAARVDPTMIRY